MRINLQNFRPSIIAHDGNEKEKKKQYGLSKKKNVNVNDISYNWDLCGRKKTPRDFGF